MYKTRNARTKPADAKIDKAQNKQIKQIKSEVKQIRKSKQTQRQKKPNQVRRGGFIGDDYVRAVIFPEQAAPTRLPSSMSVPSAVCKFSKRGTCTPNATGFFRLFCNPQSGAGYTITATSTALVETDLVLSTPLTLGTTLVAAQTGPFWDGATGIKNAQSWRVIGASFRAKYVGAAQNASGIMTAIYSPTNIFLSADMDQCMFKDSTLESGNNISNGVRALYQARDDGDNEFESTYDVNENGNVLVITGEGMPTAANCIAWSADVIYEYLPVAALNDIVERKFAPLDKKSIDVVDTLLSNPKVGQPTSHEYQSLSDALGYMDLLDSNKQPTDRLLDIVEKLGKSNKASHYGDKTFGNSSYSNYEKGYNFGGMY